MLAAAHKLRVKTESVQNRDYQQDEEKFKAECNMMKKIRRKEDLDDEDKFEAMKALAAKAVRREEGSSGNLDLVFRLKRLDETDYTENKKKFKVKKAPLHKEGSSILRIENDLYTIECTEDGQIRSNKELGELINNNLMINMRTFVEKTQGAFTGGPQKGKERCLEKVNSEYNGDWTQLVDLERATAVYETPREMANALVKLVEGNQDFEVVRCKDRMNKPVSEGYSIFIAFRGLLKQSEGVNSPVTDSDSSEDSCKWENIDMSESRKFVEALTRCIFDDAVEENSVDVVDKVDATNEDDEIKEKQLKNIDTWKKAWSESFLGGEDQHIKEDNDRVIKMKNLDIPRPARRLTKYGRKLADQMIQEDLDQTLYEEILEDVLNKLQKSSDIKEQKIRELRKLLREKSKDTITELFLEDKKIDAVAKVENIISRNSEKKNFQERKGGAGDEHELLKEFVRAEISRRREEMRNDAGMKLRSDDKIAEALLEDWKTYKTKMDGYFLDILSAIKLKDGENSTDAKTVLLDLAKESDPSKDELEILKKQKEDRKPAVLEKLEQKYGEIAYYDQLANRYCRDWLCNPHDSSKERLSIPELKVGNEKKKNEMVACFLYQL